MYNYAILMRDALLGGNYGSHVAGFVLVVVIIWSLVWKGWALWLAARRHEKVWFIILLIVNTVGILDLIYIFGVAKQKDVKSPKIPPEKIEAK